MRHDNALNLSVLRVTPLARRRKRRAARPAVADVDGLYREFRDAGVFDPNGDVRLS